MTTESTTPSTGQSPGQPAAPPADRPAGNFLQKLLVALLLLVVLGGGLWIWILSHSGGAARATAEQFVRDLQAGNVAAAKAKCLDSVTDADFDRYMREMGTWGSINHMTMVARELPAGPATPAGTTAVEGDIDYANLRKAFSATMIKQGETYKIRDFSFR